jgi:hypothetical protein
MVIGRIFSLLYSLVLTVALTETTIKYCDSKTVSYRSLLEIRFRSAASLFLDLLLISLTIMNQLIPKQIGF